MIGQEKQAQGDKIDYEKEVDTKAKVVREKDEPFKDMVDKLMGEVRELIGEVRELTQEVRERDQAFKAKEKEHRWVVREKDEVIPKLEKVLGMLKFSSVQFFQNFAEHRTGLYIQSRKFAERRTGPWVQVQEDPVHHSVGVQTCNRTFFI